MALAEDDKYTIKKHDQYENYKQLLSPCTIKANSAMIETLIY